MKIAAGTRVHDLLEAYPSLKDWLADYAPEFKKLQSPVLYRTVGRVATLEAAASMGGVPIEKLLDDIRTEVARRGIAAEETAGVSGPVDPAVRAERQEQLKVLIRRLHDGESTESVKADFDALTSGVDSAEIAAMEQALIAEGMPVEEVQRLCDVHVSVFKDALEAEPGLDVPEGHPVAAYLLENSVIGDITADLRTSLTTLAEADADRRPDALGGLAKGLERLEAIDVHYARKENQLFPVLERHGVEGPTKVMWGLDDEIRARVKASIAAAAAGDADVLSADLGETLRMVDDMVYKEERILFPTALDVISEPEWATMAAGDAEIGYAWIAPPSAKVDAPSAAAPGSGSAGALPLTTGALTLEQLDLLMRALPIDVTFVDEHDRVAYYSEGDRVFPRSPAVIGREVRNCHPPDSVGKVEAILAAFKAGEKDTAEFWIELAGRFVHIRYIALRDPDGAYRGCLEVTQDATHVRTLEGERRLLDW